MAKSDLDGEAYIAEYGEEAYVHLVAAYSLYIAMVSYYKTFAKSSNIDS